MVLTLTSEVFEDSEDIPQKYDCDDDGISPPVVWSGTPRGTKSFALIVEDPDAPDPENPRMTWVYWIPFNPSGMKIQILEPDWRTKLLGIITNPNVAYVLKLIGIYGLILDFYSPGVMVPRTIGKIRLLLALYAFNLLPINDPTL